MSQLNTFKKDSVNRSITLRIIDLTDGTPETGVVFNTAGIDLWYRRESSAVTSIVEVTLAALTTAHTDGGFLHISDGVYRFDIPDAAFATGANLVEFGGTVTGMVVIGGEIKLVDYDPEDTVRLGLTSLPNAAAEAAGGLIVSTLGTTDADDCLTATGFATPTNITAGTITTCTTNTDMRGTDSALLAASINLTGGAVDNVTTVATTTTNTDMRGTDSANTVAPDNTGITANGVAIAALNDISVVDILTTQMTESYSADGVAPTLTQSLMLIQQILGDQIIAGTTMTVREIDGATTAATFTLNDGTNPTGITRTT